MPAGKKSICKSITRIGYNATKKQHYYGLKGNFEVNKKGVILAYELSAASVHDINMVEPLLKKYSSHMVLANQRKESAFGHRLEQIWKDMKKKTHHIKRESVNILKACFQS